MAQQAARGKGEIHANRTKRVTEVPCQRCHPAKSELMLPLVNYACLEPKSSHLGEQKMLSELPPGPHLTHPPCQSQPLELKSSFYCLALGSSLVILGTHSKRDIASRLGDDPWLENCASGTSVIYNPCFQTLLCFLKDCGPVLTTFFLLVK